jgi:AraC family transcriptional regulator
MKPEAGRELFGRVIKRRDVSGLRLTETSYAASAVIPRHSHDHPYLCLVLAGPFSERHGQDERTCHRGTVVLYPAGEPHTERFGPLPGRLFNVEVMDGSLDRCEVEPGWMNRSAHFAFGPVTLLAARLFEEFWAVDDASVLATEGLALQLFAEIGRLPHPRRQTRLIPHWLAAARDLLNERFTERLRLGTVAQAVGIHPVHLATVFRRHYGFTPATYVRRLRIDLARRELSGSDSPLADIAYRAGFADQSHFSRTFRRLTGLTPSEFRFVHRGTGSVPKH